MIFYHIFTILLEWRCEFLCGFRLGVCFSLYLICSFGFALVGAWSCYMFRLLIDLYCISFGCYRIHVYLFMWVWHVGVMFWLLCIMTGVIIWRSIVYLCLVLYCLYLSNSFLCVLAMFCDLSFVWHVLCCACVSPHVGFHNVVLCFTSWAVFSFCSGLFTCFPGYIGFILLILSYILPHSQIEN